MPRLGLDTGDQDLIEIIDLAECTRSRLDQLFRWIDMCFWFGKKRERFTIRVS